MAFPTQGWVREFERRLLGSRRLTAHEGMWRCAAEPPTPDMCATRVPSLCHSTDPQAESSRCRARSSPRCGSRSAHHADGYFLVVQTPDPYVTHFIYTTRCGSRRWTPTARGTDVGRPTDIRTRGWRRLHRGATACHASGHSRARSCRSGQDAARFGGRMGAGETPGEGGRRKWRDFGVFG